MKKEFLICLLLLVLVNLVNASSVELIENTAWQSDMTGVRFSTVSLGDIDNDGDDDLAVIGCLTSGGQTCSGGTIAKIYINNGSSFVENETWQSNLTAVGFGSLAFGDIDNDGDLDLSLTGCNSSSGSYGSSCQGQFNKIYINNGTSLVENEAWQENLIGLSDSSASFGDIDNDGDLDLVINGAKFSAPFYVTKIYINNGTSLVESETWQDNLTGIKEGQTSLGDIDNDGDLDLVLIGDKGSNSAVVDLYINNGTSFVSNSTWNANLLGGTKASSMLGDYDNDGDLDLITCSLLAGDHCYLYKNTGSTLELNQTRDDGLPGMYRASIAFGDYDNDGDLDLAALGNEAGRAKVHENNETNNYYFQNDDFASSNVSADLLQGTFVWSDVDGDMDLDLIMVGGDFVDGNQAKVFINNNTVSNTLPVSPTTFTSNFSDGVLNLSWGNGSDSETPNLGLYYNLMIGNSTVNHTIVSGVYGGSSGGSEGSGAGANGYFGNMMQRKSISLNVDLSNGTYNWYVQTIDTGLAKSNWSAMQSFTVVNETVAPNITSISSSVTSTTATITWTTDETANSTVYYGTTVATSSNSSSVDLVISHSVSLSSLSASTLYYYNVSSCDYWENCNASIQYNFTTSAAASSSGGSSSGGGGGGGSTVTTYTANENELKEGYTKELSKGNKIGFDISGNSHSLEFNGIVGTLVNLTLRSDPINFFISTGEEKKFDLDGDSVLDLLIRLNSIIGSKVNLTIREINESVVDDESIVGHEFDEEKIKSDLESEDNWIYGLVVGLVILVIFGIVLWKETFNK